MEKVAYLKHGDVVNEIFETGEIPHQVFKGGPFYYITTFLNWSRHKKKLIISYGTRNKKMRYALTKGIVLRRKGYCFDTRIFKAIVEAKLFLQTFWHLMLFRPDWTLCTASYGPLFAGYVVSKLYHKPFVVSRQAKLNINGYRLLNRFEINFNKAVIKDADAILCHGPFIEDQLLDIDVPPDRICKFAAAYHEVLNNAKGKLTTHNQILSKSKINILYIGRIERTKGAFLLLDAFYMFNKNNIDAKLFYVGDGTAETELMNQISKYGLGKNVAIVGTVPHADIGKFIRACYCVVVPTLKISGEGNPKVVVEAMVVGRPVIAPEYGTFKYFIDDYQNGLFFKPDCAKDLCQKLDEIIKDKTLYEALKSGSNQKGKRLLTPEATFGDALACAYRLSMQ